MYSRINPPKHHIPPLDNVSSTYVDFKKLQEVIFKNLYQANVK